MSIAQDNFVYMASMILEGKVLNGIDCYAICCNFADKVFGKNNIMERNKHVKSCGLSLDFKFAWKTGIEFGDKIFSLLIINFIHFCSVFFQSPAVDEFL